MNITIECPECLPRKLAPLTEVHRSATEFVHRTCQHCGWRWRIKVVPRIVPGVGIAHILHFHAVSNRDDRRQVAKVPPTNRR